VVVDASVVLELLLRTPRGIRLERRLLGGAAALAAPHLIDVEVAQVLRRYARTGELDDRRGGEALEDLADLPIDRYPHVLLVPRIWALRAGLTAYDAAYVALAELLRAPLLTCDKRLGRTTGHAARIETV
jgi:predicted nucleic acid-binding protein